MGGSPFSLERLQALKAKLSEKDTPRPNGDFATFRLVLQDDDHSYFLAIRAGYIESVSRNVEVLPSDLVIAAGSEAWSDYLQEIPSTLHADLLEMFTEKRGEIKGMKVLFWQNLEFIDNLMRLLGHRVPLYSSEADHSATAEEHGTIDGAIGRYVHINIDGHTYRTFFEENGKGIPLVLLHAANSDARMWRHQLADPDLTNHYRVIAFDMPWHGRSIPPQELLRTEYLLTSSFYRRFVRAFCEALNLHKPILAGCSMGGYLLFHVAYHDPGFYRALVAIAARDFENRRWEGEANFRNPAISFNRTITAAVRGFMAPTDPPGCVDEVAWIYETGNPRTIRGDLHFAALDADARPFLSRLDLTRTPFYLLGGEYDWSCTEEHTGRIVKAQPAIKEVRMKGIGHFPPDENPEVFKQYFLPALNAAVKESKDLASKI